MAFKRVNYCQKELHVWCFIVPQSASVFIVVFWANIFEEPDLVKNFFFLVKLGYSNFKSHGKVTVDSNFVINLKILSD